MEGEETGREGEGEGETNGKWGGGRGTPFAGVEATVRAVGEGASVLSVNKGDFDKVLGPIKDGARPASVHACECVYVCRRVRNCLRMCCMRTLHVYVCVRVRIGVFVRVCVHMRACLHMRARVCVKYLNPCSRYVDGV